MLTSMLHRAVPYLMLTPMVQGVIPVMEAAEKVMA